MKLINYNDLVKKPKELYLVKSGTLELSDVDFHGHIIKGGYKINFSVDKNNFFECFYSIDETMKSCILVKLDLSDNEKLWNYIYNPQNNLFKKNILDPTSLIDSHTHSLKFDKSSFNLSINQESQEAYAVIDISLV